MFNWLKRLRSAVVWYILWASLCVVSERHKVPPLKPNGYLTLSVIAKESFEQENQDCILQIVKQVYRIHLTFALLLHIPKDNPKKSCLCTFDYCTWMQPIMVNRYSSSSVSTEWKIHKKHTLDTLKSDTFNNTNSFLSSRTSNSDWIRYLINTSGN